MYMYMYMYMGVKTILHVLTDVREEGNRRDDGRLLPFYYQFEGGDVNLVPHVTHSSRLAENFGAWPAGH